MNAPATGIDDIASIGSTSAAASVSGKYVSAVIGPNRAIGAFNSPTLKADFNSDFSVGLSDLAYFASVYGNTEEYDPLFDLNDDGSVGLADLAILAGMYGQSIFEQ